MLALDTQTQGSNVSPTEWNGMLSEIQNLIEDVGITISTIPLTKLFQLSQAIGDYCDRSTWYTGAGTAAAQTLTSLGNIEGPDSYANGMRVRWRPSNASVAGGTTINVNAMGAKTILKEDGVTALAANDLLATKDAEARYNGTNFLLIGA